MLNWLFQAVASIIVAIHGALSPIFGYNSGWSWGLAIVLLTVMMRLILFPLFVKQIKTQRVMQQIQPQIKELQQKYKGDRETLNTEMMKLYKESGANPLTGCLPLLLQMPIFFALFRVLNSIHPDSNGTYHAVYGMTAAQVESFSNAKVFGAPLAAAFRSPPWLLEELNASQANVRIVAFSMVCLMAATTFWTQRQLMIRNTRQQTSPTQFQSQQKILLYVLPFTFFISGFICPIGVMVYMVTTNLWSMGQQHFVIARMPDPNARAKDDAPPEPPVVRPKGTPKAASALTDGGGSPTGPSSSGSPRGQAGTSRPTDSSKAPATTPSSPAGAAPANRRPANRNRRAGKRGGRR